MPRFVVLHHQTPAGYPRGTHFDLILERDDVLQTWALEKLPAGGEAVAADRLADHRLAYLDYEGEVSGNRGSVSRVDEGEYAIVSETGITAHGVSGPQEIVAALFGKELRGTLTLTHEDTGAQRWRVSFSPG